MIGPNPKNYQFSNKDISILRRTISQLPQLQNQKLLHKIQNKETNHIDFYNIIAKQQLPKSLQKMNFQTLNTKQTNANQFVKIYDKERQKLTEQERVIRKNMRQKNGDLIMLSEIYESFDDDLDRKKEKDSCELKDVTTFTNVIGELDQWEKKAYKKKNTQHFPSTLHTGDRRTSKVRITGYNQDPRRPSTMSNVGSTMSSSHKKQFIVKKFKIGSDYKAQIQKNLELIGASHANQTNWLTKYALIQNSSKLIKKQLQQMKQMIQKQIEEKLKKLSQSRKQHHRLYQQKLRFHLEEQQLEEQLAKQQGNILQLLSISTMGYNYHAPHQSANPPKLKNVLADKKNQAEKNQSKIVKIKKNIQFMEEETLKNQEELKNILAAEKTYYQISLKNGIDFRENGLVWIIKKLGYNAPVEQNMNTEALLNILVQNALAIGLQFPEYLDKKSKAYLLNKTKNQSQLEQFITEKRNFVNEIGKQNKTNSPNRRSQIRRNSIKLMQKSLSINHGSDMIKQNPHDQSDIPKKYIRSAQKITALRQQYLQNENLLRMSQSRGGLRFGYHLEGMTGREIYNFAGEKIKQVDFSKLKKQKTHERHDKIFEYQAILRRIQQLHMHMQEQDIQQQNHLLSHYRDNKQLFFMHAAASFGVKRAYSLIIKNFSWKNQS